MSSLSDGHRHIRGKDLGCTLPTVFHSFLCFVLCLIGFLSGAEQRVSELPPLCAAVFFSVFFLLSPRVTKRAGKDKYIFQNTRKLHLCNSWLSNTTSGIIILLYYHCQRHILLTSFTYIVSSPCTHMTQIRFPTSLRKNFGVWSQISSIIN